MKKLSILFIVLAVLQLAAALRPEGSAAASPALRPLEEKLENWDVENIWPEVEEALSQAPRDAELLEIAAHIAYHRGDYGESLVLMKKSIDAGGQDEGKKGFALFIEETIAVLAPYKRYETAHFLIWLDEKQDGILADYLIDALEKTHAAMAVQYGFQPGEKVRVELFPDATAFYRASALSVRDIEVTGAVGLTKFNKLQFLSPRALVHGYRWLDAISHEYMHYLIMKMTSNKAPIWFHEGLAKYEETRWRKGPDYLSPLSRTLLARASEENGLIGFEKMEPSLLQLETPAEVQLAYAQSASAIEFIIKTGGYEGLRKIMRRMAGNRARGATESIKETLGLEFNEFERRWKAFLAAKKLVPLSGATVRPYKVRQGEGNDERMDLTEIKSLVSRNRAYLGDRLKEKGRLRAAALEYRRALAEGGDSVPVMTRLSAALIALGRDNEAQKVLEEALALDPDYPTPHVQLGMVFAKRRDFIKAGAAFEEAVQINPFNPLVHAELAEIYRVMGKESASLKERGIVLKLKEMR